MKKILLIILFASFSVLPAQNDAYRQSEAQEEYKLQVPDIVSERCSDFFKTMIEGETEQAFKTILKDSPIKEKEDKIDELIKQARRANNIYGRAISYEQVSTENVASSLVRLRYMALHEEYPMRWIFTFYKSPKHGWIVVNIRFDDMSEYFFTD